MDSTGNYLIRVGDDYLKRGAFYCNPLIDVLLTSFKIARDDVDVGNSIENIDEIGFEIAVNSFEVSFDRKPMWALDFNPIFHNPASAQLGVLNPALQWWLSMLSSRLIYSRWLLN